MKMNSSMLNSAAVRREYDSIMDSQKENCKEIIKKEIIDASYVKLAWLSLCRNLRKFRLSK